MLSKNKKALFLTSLLTLLPIPLAFLLLRSLPQASSLSILDEHHFLLWSLGISLGILGAQWLCIGLTVLDPKHRGGQNRLVFSRILWIFPGISLFSFLLLWEVALGLEIIRFTLFYNLFFGLLFLFIGNYLPKLRQSNTIGIRCSWTLGDEENWYATHRIAGKIWVTGGIVILLSSLLPSRLSMALFLICLVGMIFIPLGYSYQFYRKKLASGISCKDLKPQRSPAEKKWFLALALFLAVVLLLVSILLFAGSIQFSLGETALSVHTPFCQGITLPYNDILSVEYREGSVSALRTWGYGSAKLQLGLFHNNELGDFTRYTYATVESYLLIQTSSSTIVLAEQSAEATQSLYHNLMQHTP